MTLCNPEYQSYAPVSPGQLTQSSGRSFRNRTQNYQSAETSGSEACPSFCQTLIPGSSFPRRRKSANVQISILNCPCIWHDICASPLNRNRNVFLQVISTPGTGSQRTWCCPTNSATARGPVAVLKCTQAGGKDFGTNCG
jgi:hypothetical protein